MTQTILKILLILILSTDALAKGRKKTHINLPKVVDTATNNVSVHEDINLYGNYPTALSSTTMDFGFSHNWDVGIGVYSVPIDSHIDGYDISVLFNLERTFNITPTLSVLAGSSVGSDIVSTGNSGIDIYSYITGVMNLWAINFNLGGYYANSWLAGYNTLGLTVSIAIPINNAWSFQYEYLSGTNNLSGSTYQLFYKINKDINLGFGIQPQYSNREQIMSGIMSLYYR